MTTPPTPLRPREDRDYWRHACPKCDALHPVHQPGADGADHYECWSCGHRWGMWA